MLCENDVGRTYLGLYTLGSLLVLISVLLGLGQHSLDLLLGQSSLVVGDGDLGRFSGGLVGGVDILIISVDLSRLDMGLTYLGYRSHQHQTIPQFGEHLEVREGYQRARIYRASYSPLSWLAHPRRPG